MVDARWAHTWEKADGEKTAEAQWVAKGYQDQDLRMGNVDIAGCVCRRSSHLRPISRTHFARRMNMIARFIFALHAGGIPKIPAAYRNPGHPRMG